MKLYTISSGVLLALCAVCQAIVTDSFSSSVVDYYDLGKHNLTTEEREYIEKRLQKFLYDELTNYKKVTAHVETSRENFNNTNKISIKAEKAVRRNHVETEDSVQIFVNEAKLIPDIDLKILVKLSAEEYLGNSSNDRLFLVSSDGVKNVTYFNSWTRSNSGCQCMEFGPEECACCFEGGCLCRSNMNICTKCSEDSLDCLNLGTVADSVSFGYESDSSSGFRQAVVIAARRKLHFYSYNPERQILTERSSSAEKAFFPNEINSLSSDTLITYGTRGFQKRTMLFVFSKLGASNQIFEIVLENDFFNLIKIHEWSVKGREFKVIRLAGRSFIGYDHEGMFQLNEVKIGSRNAEITQFQQFPRFAIDSWRFFKNQHKDYILLKSVNLVQIHEFKNGKFDLFQLLKLPKDLKEVKIVNIHFKGGELPVLIFYGQEMLFYAQDGLNKEWQIVQETSFENGVTKGIVVFQDIPYLLIASEIGLELYEIKVEASTSDTQSEELTKILTGEFSDLMKSLDEIRRKVKATNDNRRLIIQNRATFQTVWGQHINGKVTEESLESLKQFIELIERNIQLTEAALERTKSHLLDVVPKTGSSKYVRGVKHFYGRKTSIKELSVAYANVGHGSEGSLDKMLQNLVRIKDQRQIKGRKVFRGTVVVKDLHTSTLNHKGASNYVTTKKPSTIDGASYANGISIQNNVILGPDSRVDGIDLSEEVVQQNGHYELGSCHFRQLDAGGGINVETDLVNQNYFSQFTDSIFQTEGNFTVPESATFTRLTVKKNLEARSLMGVKSDLLFSEILLKSQDEHLANVLFEDSIRCQDLEAVKINNEEFPKNFVVRRKDSWINFGTKSVKKINFRQLIVNGLVDHVNTSDIVTKSTPQEILGIKKFERGIKVKGDLNVLSNYIDGVDMTIFSSNVTTSKKNVIVFEEDVKVPHLQVNGQVNNMKFEEISEDLIYQDEEFAKISGKKIFLKDLKVNERIYSKFINNYNTSSFVDLKKRNKISARKVFSGDLNIDTLNVRGLIDNTDVTNLFQESLYLGKPFQVVTGEKYFDTLTADHLRVVERLNENSFEDLLTKSTDQRIDKVMYLREAAFDLVQAQRIDIAENGTLNGKNLDSLAKKLKMDVLDDNLVIDGDVVIKNNFKINNINGINVKDIQNIFLKDEPLQVLTNDLQFKLLEIDGPAATDSFTSGNATLLKKMTRSAFHLSKNNFGSKDVYWENIEVDEIDVVKLINGIDLKELERDSVYLNDPITFSIKGTKHFVNGVEVVGDVDASTINGKDFRNNLFSRTTPQRISSKFVFNRLIVPSITLKTFNGIDLNRIIQAERKGRTIINGPITFGGYVNISHLEIGALFQNESIDAILEDAVKLDDKKIVISGKTFVMPPVFEDLTIESLNGKYQEIQERRHLERSFLNIVTSGTVFARRLKANHLIIKNETSFLHGTNLRKNFVLVDEKIEGPLKFQNLVIKGEASVGSIKDYEMKYFLTKKTEQFFPNPISFSSMRTTNVSVGGRINDYKISRTTLPKGEITKELHGPILKRLTIDSDLLVKGDFVYGRNKFRIPEDVVQLNRKNKITGLLSFTNQVVTPRIESSTNKLNGMDLNFLRRSLDGYRTFFKENIVEQDGESFNYLNIMQNIYQRECHNTMKLEYILKDSYVQPHSFGLVSTQKLNTSRFTISSPNESRFTSPVLIYEFASRIWMVNSLDVENCRTDVLRWNEFSKKFELMYSLGNSGNVKRWIVLESSQETIYLLAVSTGNGHCGSKGSSLWRAKTPNIRLKKIKVVEEAVDVLVKSRKSVYFDLGYKFFEYTLDNETLSKTLSKGPSIKILRTLQFPNGNELMIKVYEGNFVEIIDTTPKVGSRITYMLGITDVNLLNHMNDVIVIISLLRMDAHESYWYHEVFRYKNLNLLPVMQLNLDGHSKLTPLHIPEDETNSTFVLALFDSASPKIFKMGGQPFMKVWEEFPMKLGVNPWSSEFVDSRGVYHLVLGDGHRLHVLQMRKSGAKYNGEIIDCS